MSAREQGRRIIKEVEDYEAKFDLGQKLEAQAPADNGIGAAEAFPARYLYPDERDKKYDLRRALNTKLRPDPITDDEIDYLLDKTTAFETAEFHKWFSRLYKMDDSNPVMKKWGMELVPELWQMKEQSIEDNARLQTQLAKIKLRGIRTRDDLTLMWAIAKGAISVPAGPIYAPTIGETLYDSKRGVFNPRHLAGRIGNYNGGAAATQRGASWLIDNPGGFGDGRNGVGLGVRHNAGEPSANAFGGNWQQNTQTQWAPNAGLDARIAAGRAAVGQL
jgi:hypothetical protein